MYYYLLSLKHNKGKENDKSCGKNHWKELCLSKKPSKEQNQRRRGKAEKGGGGRLLGQERLLGKIW